jgi:hypothetical protein
LNFVERADIHDELTGTIDCQWLRVCNLVVGFDDENIAVRCAEVVANDKRIGARRVGRIGSFVKDDRSRQDGRRGVGIRLHARKF